MGPQVSARARSKALGPAEGTDTFDFGKVQLPPTTNSSELPSSLLTMNAPDELMTLKPAGSFVLKTRLLSSRSRPQGTKVFINVCTDPQVPLPKEPYEPPNTYQLIMENQWEIPIVTSEEREDTDKKGQLSLVHDAVVNDEAMRWVQRDPQLRDILMEWCMESVEVRSDVVLDREKVTVPKMTSKGHPVEIKLLKTELEGRLEPLEEPSDILNIKRAVEDEPVEISITPTPSTRPLIQEISELTIKERPIIQRAKGATITNGKERLLYSTSMSKIDAGEFKLRIDISSQNTSSLDYHLDLDRTTNTLVLKNLNSQFQGRDLELPLPTIFTHPELKSFFVATENKLVIFVK